MTELGKVLRKIRIDIGITQKQMADTLLVSPAYLSSVELGYKNVTEVLECNIYTAYEQLLPINFDDLILMHNGVLNISQLSDNDKLEIISLYKEFNK